MIEAERHTMELTGVFPSMGESKTHITRKLRRRPHDPAPVNNDKRRKPSPTQLNFMLNDEEVLEDLKVGGLVHMFPSVLFGLGWDYVWEI